MAVPESRRKKLRMLTRSIATGDIKAAEDMLRARREARQAQPPEPMSLAAAAPGRVAGTRGESYWLIQRSLSEIMEESAEIQRRYASVLRGAGQRFDELSASAAVCHVADGTPEGPLFVDIETCGLSGACIFLVGVMSFHEGELRFEQLLARHYGEERPVLAAFARRLAEAETLISFNGKAFDMTSIRDRSVYHGLEPPSPPPHCDLLHESRRLWRDCLPNCRLQTLERFLCKRHRVDDIPGDRIPDAYHGWVASGDARLLKDILHHNLLDLLTMSEILCAVLTGRGPDVDS